MDYHISQNKTAWHILQMPLLGRRGGQVRKDAGAFAKLCRQLSNGSVLAQTQTGGIAKGVEVLNAKSEGLN